MDLTHTHDDYDATQAVRQKARDLYDGSDVVKAAESDYLYQENNESDTDYELRLKRAVFDPYCEKIINARQALLFRREHVRVLPPELEFLRADADNYGTIAPIFFAEAARDAQIDGIHWVCVDATKLNTTFTSMRQQQEAGYRVFFEHIPAANVIDWEIGEDDKLNWAVVSQNGTEPRTPGEAPVTRSQWKVWTRTGWVIYEASSDDGTSAYNARKTTSYVVVDQGEHPLGVVPLVPFYGFKRCACSGWPVTRNLLDYVLAIYNKRSDLDWFERLAAHPIPYVISAEKPEKLDAGAGLWVRSGPNVGQVMVAYLETNGTGFDSIRSSISELNAKIYATALAQAQYDSAQVQSAETIREERKIFSNSLIGSSFGYEAAESECWKIAAKWLKADPNAVVIEYNRDFDDVLIETTMIDTLNGLADSGRLTTKTLLTTLRDGECLPDEFDVEQELAALKAEQAERDAIALQIAARTPPVQPAQEEQ